MNLEQNLLLRAVKASVTGALFSLTEEPDWSAFLSLAKAHKLEALAFDGLQKSGIGQPVEIQQQLNTAYMQVIFRDAQLEHVKSQLQSALVAAGVDHVFLKGSVLKHSYPIPAMRTMTDMDILVHTEDYEAIDRVCAALGGQSQAGDGNHRNFYFPNGVKIEFHPNIVHQASPVGTDINPGWQYAKKEPAFGTMELTEEGFYMSILCHLVDHFVDGGIGIRFILDVWVFRNLRKAPMDRAFVEQELEKFGLLEFVKNIERLSEAWFGDGESDPILEELAEYIITSGSHGIADRAMLNAVSLSKGGSKASAFWEKVFYPRQELEDRYPWCKGKAWLLPAAWCTRAFRAVTTHGAHILAWSKGTGSVTDDQVSRQKEKLARFGIRRKSIS